MKYLLIFLLCVCMTGCFMAPVEEPEPVTESVAEPGVHVEILDVVWDDEGYVCCSVKNTGTFDTLAFSVTFCVFYVGGGVEEIVACVSDGVDVGESLVVCGCAQNCAGYLITDVTAVHNI